jgi:Na+-driven multidrug efflux pump
MSVTIDKKGFNRELRTLALPIALQHLMLAAVAAADALMLGRVAQDQMTAVSLATQIQFVQNMFLTAVTGAGAILGAQYWGKGDRHTMKELFNLMLRAAGLLSLAFFAACCAISVKRFAMAASCRPMLASLIVQI